MWIWIILLVSLIFIYLKVYKPHQKWSSMKVPQVKPWPFFGNMASFVFRQKPVTTWINDIYTAHDTRYIGFYKFNQAILLIKDLNLIKQLGIKDFDNFMDHSSVISDDDNELFSKNLFTLKGQKWRNMRSSLSPAFTGSKMRSMFVLMSDCAEQFTNYFKEHVDPSKPMTIEMKDVFTRYANDVIATCAFGITCDSMKEKEHEFYMMGKKITNFGGIRSLKVFGYIVIPMLMRLFKVRFFSDDESNFFRNIVSSNIKSREEQGIVRPDMIHLLMEARKGKLKHENHKVKDEDAGFATVEESEVGKEVQHAKQDLSDDDITAQALIFFIAGFDTISTVACHMAYELALNEDIQQILQEEIDTTLNKCNGQITYDAIIKMKYLDMVLSEALRKWPPVEAVDRVCIDTYTIPAENPNENPITLKKNDVILFSNFSLQRDPQYFPDPDKFEPERFSDENKGNIKPFSYIPFGVGPRNCIGSRFALLEAKVVFVHLLSKFSFEICEKSQVPLRLIRGQFSMDSESGFWLGLKLRK